MVLKINSNQDNWRYIDWIAQVQVDLITPERYKQNYRGSGRTYDNEFLCYHKINDELTLVDKSTIVTVKEVTVWYGIEGKKPDCFIVDVTAYLMSDDGKTIERIN